MLGQQELFEFNSLSEHSLRNCADNAEEILNSVAHCGRMSDELPIAGSTRELFRTALEIAPEQHVRMQAAFQKHVDNAVSKTVNLPNEASLEQVSHVYRMAHRLGCKGVTVFRYGSKRQQVLELGSGEAGHEREYFARCDPDACKLYKTGLQTHPASSEPTYIGQRLSAGHEGSADA